MKIRTIVILVSLMFLAVVGVIVGRFLMKQYKKYMMLQQGKQVATRAMSNINMMRQMR